MRLKNHHSYILTLTRLGDEDDGAAETGVTETTRVATVYPHPTNDKIKFWDLPCTGAYQMLVVVQLRQVVMLIAKGPVINYRGGGRACGNRGRGGGQIFLCMKFALNYIKLFLLKKFTPLSQK
jgi:hypothetical protein